ncbi:MAG: radical SAM protein [candidate division WOR-3 bacterium]|nr:radical SAM protein [candidate division WOR-3 bacterium]
MLIKKPLSMGLFLTYKCNAECQHCMYGCGPGWKADWIKLSDAEKIFASVSESIKGLPDNRIGINYGLHFTGGEPFLNFDLLLELTRLATRFNIPSLFVETNCFWCKDEETTEKKLLELKKAGLHGILISINPFILENVPFERTENCIRASERIFGVNVIVYQHYFYQIFKTLSIKTTMPAQRFFEKIPESLYYIELLPMGRTVYKLRHIFQKHKAEYFFGYNCREELFRNWHIHFDNYGNYIPGYCSGLSLGNINNIERLFTEFDTSKFPIIRALCTDIKKLYELGRKYGYDENEEGYISGCHLCLDIRKKIVSQTDRYFELRPREFYLSVT